MTAGPIQIQKIKKQAEIFVPACVVFASTSVALNRAAVLLGFGFIFAQSQAAYGHAPSLKHRQNTKIPRCLMT